MATSDAPLNVPDVTLAATRAEAPIGEAPSAPPVFTTSSGSNSISAAVSEANGATNFNIRVDGGAAQEGTTISGLTPEQTYSVELQGVNEFGASAWSTPVEETTIAEGAALTALERRFTIQRSFNGTDGVKTSLEADGFDGSDGRSTYSNEQAFSGTTSGRMQLLLTDSNGGFGNWGGSIVFPNDLIEGEEIFLRWRMYYPAGFSFISGTANDRIKFNRVHTKSASGANKGYLDIYYDRESEPVNYVYIKEFSPNQFMGLTTEPYLYDQWVTYNLHYVFHSDPTLGRVRFYRNSDVYSEKITATLSDPTDVADFMYQFTYWNGNVPQEQHCYVDDFVITSDRALTVINPSTGLPWIGL